MVIFPHEKISEHITRIHGTGGEMMYLVEGEKSAALIDTGSGIGSLKTLIDQLTDKPYIILLTHGHVDHAMGAPEFDVPVYMNQKDVDVLKEHSGMGIRKGGLAMADPEVVAKIVESDYITPPKDSFLPLHEFDSFALGGLTIETYDCPGHTPGSVAFLIKEERTLLLGDACNFFTFMFFDYSLPIPEYKQALLRVKELTAGKFDKVLLSHGSGEAEPAILDGVIAVCDDIVNGNVDNIPFSFQGDDAFIAKALTPRMERVDGGLGNIVYRPKSK